MKLNSQTSSRDEFRELTSGITETMEDVGDAIAIGKMLFLISEEKKSNNLVVKDINGKFDQMMAKLDRIATLLEEAAKRSEMMPAASKRPDNIDISDRDQEILEFVRSHKKVCADDVQDHFKYRGRNAASARLNKLFRDNVVDKIYAGRNVYYTLRTQ